MGAMHDILVNLSPQKKKKPKTPREPPNSRPEEPNKCLNLYITICCVYIVTSDTDPLEILAMSSVDPIQKVVWVGNPLHRCIFLNKKAYHNKVF